MLRALLVLAALILLTACAVTSGPPISDEERCTRYGGIWQLGTCKIQG